jgi:hypothetical protein
MTTPTPRSRKVVRSLSWLSTRHDSTRSNIQMPDQFVQQSSLFKTHCQSLIGRLAIRQPVAPRSLPLGASSVALKSP